MIQEPVTTTVNQHAVTFFFDKAAMAAARQILGFVFDQGSNVILQVPVIGTVLYGSDVQVGDVVVSVQGHPVQTKSEFIQSVNKLGSGPIEVNLAIQRQVTEEYDVFGY